MHAASPLDPAAAPENASSESARGRVADAGTGSAEAVPVAAEAGRSPDRRGFFSGLVRRLAGSAMAIGFACLAATHLLWLLSAARFFFPNVLVEPPLRFKAGFPGSYQPGLVETRFVAQHGAWIVSSRVDGQQQIFALRAVCTHLGCTPIWLESEQKFKCPCHGSGFTREGMQIEGPAPRPLERFAIRVAEDGQLEVDKSRTFRQEFGQWRDPDCHV